MTFQCLGNSLVIILPARTNSYQFTHNFYIFEKEINILFYNWILGYLFILILLALPNYLSIDLTMKKFSFFFPLSVWSFLISVTIYSIYVGFGPPSFGLRDPFEEHQDLSFLL